MINLYLKDLTKSAVSIEAKTANDLGLSLIQTDSLDDSVVSRLDEFHKDLGTVSGTE